MNIDHPRFYLDDAAKGAGVSRKIVDSWLSRQKMLVRDQAVLSPGKGRSRLFSLRDVYRLAITATLVGLGVSVKGAATAAVRFTDVSSAKAQFVPSGVMPDTTAGRAPGELFKNGWTVLTVPAGGKSEIVNIGRNASFAEAVIELKAARGAAIVIVDEIVAEVHRRVNEVE